MGIMLVLPFTKRARARDVALEELRPLLAMRGVPANFWELPYGLGFIFGYTRAIAMEITSDSASDSFVSDVTSAVLVALVGTVEVTLPVMRRVVTWKNNSHFLEGRRNGYFFALFMHGSPRADETAFAAEAFKQARERAPVFDQLRETTNERGRAAMILCDILFFDKLFERPASTQREIDVAKPTAGEPLEPKSSYRVGAQEAQKLPFSQGTIWLESNEIWFSFPSKDFSVSGRAYHIPGGAMCFQRDPNGREALLKYLQSERDFWAPGNEAEWVKRAEAFHSK
jgi:hypothetical protein